MASRKPLVVLVCVTFALVMFLGSVALAAKTETIEFWSWRTEDVEAYGKIIKEFEAANPDIDVQFKPYKNTEYNTILATALQAGEGPDVIQLRSYGGMEPFAKAGYLEPLGGKVPGLDGFGKEFLRAATYRGDGKLYGVPFAIQTIQVIYNKKVFKKLGLDIPETWDELISAAKTLKAAGYFPFANTGKEAWTLEITWGGVGPAFYGGPQFFEEIVSGKTTFQDPRFIESVRRVRELKPYLPDGFLAMTYSDETMLFMQERAAMVVGNTADAGVYANTAPNLEMGVFPIPPLKKGQKAYVGAYVDGSYGVNARSKHKEAALKFVQFTATKKFGQMFAEYLGQISAVPGVKPADKLVAAQVDLMEKGSSPYMMLVAFRYDQPSGSTLIQNGLQQVMADQITPEALAASIHKGLSQWYQPFKK